jgi:hypothetical protein
VWRAFSLPSQGQKFSLDVYAAVPSRSRMRSAIHWSISDKLVSGIVFVSQGAKFAPLNMGRLCLKGRHTKSIASSFSVSHESACGSVNATGDASNVVQKSIQSAGGRTSAAITAMLSSQSNTFSIFQRSKALWQTCSRYAVLAAIFVAIDSNAVIAFLGLEAKYERNASEL